MLRGMYTSVSSMITLQSRQSVVANNLANINTTGYKEEKLLTKSFDEVILSNKDNYINGQANRQVLGGLSFGVAIDETIAKHSQGTHVATENNTDFALDGSGFFHVRDANGQDFYTRDGSFKIDSQGFLVTNAGYNVMGRNQATGNLEPIYIGSINESISVTSDNNININGINTYRFNVVDFNNYDELNKVGNNVYSGENPIQTNNFLVRQGYLEGSNVDAIEATAELMETARAFEANQKIIQTIDSTLGQIASEIGSVR